MKLKESKAEALTARILTVVTGIILLFGASVMTTITPVGMNPTGQFSISQPGDTFTNIAQVANSGSYTDLINQPNLPTVYFGNSVAASPIMYTASATVASGTATFQLTANGISTGTPIFPNGPNTDSLNAFVSDATASYQMSSAWSNSNKTLAITTNKLTTANILTGILGQSAANGSVVRVVVWGS